MCLEVFSWLGLPILQRKPIYLSIYLSIHPSIHPPTHYNFTVTIHPNTLLVLLCLSHNSPTKAVGKCCYYRQGIKVNQWKRRELAQRHWQSQNPSGLLWASQLQAPTLLFFCNHSSPGERTHAAWKRQFQSMKQNSFISHSCFAPR